MKKEKNIEILENEQQVNGQTVSELLHGKHSLGTIEPNGKRYLIHYPNGQEAHVSSRTAAVDALIREFHLHNS